MAFTSVRYSIVPTRPIGCPLLVNSPATEVSITQASSGLVFTATAGSDLAQAPYKFYPQFPLTLKLFFSQIVTNAIGSFNVLIYGNGFNPSKIERSDINSFGTVLWIKDWNNSNPINVNVALQPLTPVTTISLKCFAGLATDVMDTPEGI